MSDDDLRAVVEEAARLRRQSGNYSPSTGAASGGAPKSPDGCPICEMALSDFSKDLPHHIRNNCDEIDRQ